MSSCTRAAYQLSAAPTCTDPECAALARERRRFADQLEPALRAARAVDDDAAHRRESHREHELAAAIAVEIDDAEHVELDDRLGVDRVAGIGLGRERQVV